MLSQKPKNKIIFTPNLYTTSLFKTRILNTQFQNSLTTYHSLLSAKRQICQHYHLCHKHDATTYLNKHILLNTQPNSLLHQLANEVFKLAFTSKSNHLLVEQIL